MWIQGCGGGGGGYSSPPPPPPPPPSASPCGAGLADISANHGHTLTILKADLDSTASKTYNLGLSTEGHTHQVTFTVAQLQALKGGGTVTVTSTTTTATALYGGTHSHTVNASVAVVSCA